MAGKIAVISTSPIKTDFDHDYYGVEKKLSWDPDQYDFILVCGSQALKSLKLGKLNAK